MKFQQKIQVNKHFWLLAWINSWASSIWNNTSRKPHTDMLCYLKTLVSIKRIYLFNSAQKFFYHLWMMFVICLQLNKICDVNVSKSPKLKKLYKNFNQLSSFKREQNSRFYLCQLFTQLKYLSCLSYISFIFWSFFHSWVDFSCLLTCLGNN